MSLPLRVYISYSWKGDLNEERDMVKELVERDLLMYPVVPSGASPTDVTINYLNLVRDSDILVVLLGALYSSHVENEFKFALENDILTLVFIKDCEHEEELKRKIELLYYRVTCKPFKTLDDLKKWLRKRLSKSLQEDFVHIVK